VALLEMTPAQVRRKNTYRPLYATPRSPERPTLGPRVAQIAELLGKPLLPHQREIVDVALELDPETGYLAYGEVVVVGPRQVTGKTELLLPVMTHRCLGFDKTLTDWIAAELGIRLGPPGPQSVLYLAQNTDESRKKWRYTHLARLEQAPGLRKLFRPTLLVNQERMTWANGSTWLPGSTTAKKAGTGDSLDLPVIDEAWSRPDSGVELGVRPAMMTRQWAQLWVASMVPGPTRKLPNEWPYLKAKITGGIGRVEADIRRGVAFFMFGAEEGMDPASPDTWWSSMPALGYTVREETVRNDFESEGMSLADFTAEYLSWMPTSSTARWAVIGEDTWRDRYDAHSQPLDPIAIGIAANQARTVASICMAARRADGDIHVELLDRRPGVAWAEDRAIELVEAWGALGIAIRPNGPAASLIEPLRARLEEHPTSHLIEVHTPNDRQYSQVCGRFFDATGEVDTSDFPRDTEDTTPPAKLWHIGQAELTQAVAGSTWRYVGGSRQFDHAAGSIDTSPVEGCTLAMWLGQLRAWEGGSYNIMQTLG
jgi:hypothetical protein